MDRPSAFEYDGMGSYRRPKIQEFELEVMSMVEIFSRIGINFGFAPFEPILQNIIAECLKEKGKDKFRKGTILTPSVLVWLCLALTLRRDLNYNKALNWLVASFRWKHLNFPVKIVKDGTISHARIKLGVDIFRNIFNKLSLSLRKCSPDFHGYISVLFDGTSMTMPDTMSNLEKFGKHKSGRGYGAFPQMRVVALMIASARCIIDVAYAPYAGKKTGERTLMFKILKRCHETCYLFLFDAGFYSFKLAYHMFETQQKYIMKIAKSVNLKPISGSQMPDGSYLSILKGKILESTDPKTGRNKWKKVEITVRVVKFHVPGFQPVTLITNLMDPMITAKEIVIHYHKRWDIEIAYDEIKTHQCATLKGHIPTILRSKRSDLVEQELYCILISYNLVRSLIKEAADKNDGDPLLISFLDTLQIIFECAVVPETGNAGKTRNYMLKMISESKIDRPRRARQNERVVKVKMSNFKRKRSADKSKYVDFMKDMEILYQLAA